MLKNKKTVYFCQECGYESAKWMGQCPGCKSWNTFVEETVSTKKPSSSRVMKRMASIIMKSIRTSFWTVPHDSPRFRKTALPSTALTAII